MKKKPLAAMEKSQSGQESEETKPKKKAKEGKAFGESRKADVFPPRLSEQELMKALSLLKAITIHGAARSLGVNASVARGVIGNLETKGLLTRVGGYSGHYVWAAAS